MEDLRWMILRSFFHVQKLLGRSLRCRVEKRGHQWALKIGSQREITVDGVVAGIGITPNVELVAAAKLTVENGIVVDEHLCTSHLDIYARRRRR